MLTLSKLSPHELTILAREVNKEVARKSLIEFTLYTKPNYLAGWFNHLLAETLDRFLEDVVQKKSPRVMIFAPPRHGKSELTSRRFPAYTLGRYPEMSFIGTSWGSDMASSINRDIQRIICSDEYKDLFPGSTLWGQNIRTVADGSYLRNSDIFEIVGHTGVYKSAGRGAGIAGRGADIALLDDIVKDAEEAGSETVRESTWDWYANDLYTRLMPGGGILLIMTRRHEDDLAGRLLENMRKGGEQWEIVNFPAVAETDEYHPRTGQLLRKIGEPLHPERYTLELLDRIKFGTSTEPGVGSKMWASLYQQRPSAAEGNIFKREYWRFFKTPTRLSSMAEGERRAYLRTLGIYVIIQAWDIAVGGKESNDYTACTTLGVSQNKLYVLNVWNKQCEFPEAKRQVLLLADAWHPTKIVIEGGGSAGGKAIIQDLKRETTLPLHETITTTDKVMRANVVSPTHEAGMCWLPEGEGWVSDFVESCSGFPNMKHDDDVDSFIMALEEGTRGRKQMRISDDLLVAAMR